MESKKDFKEFEGYFRLFQLSAEGSKDSKAIHEALVISQANFKKNSRANSSKFFGILPFNYYDQFTIAILNLFKNKGIEVDVTGFEKFPKELIQGFQ